MAVQKNFVVRNGIEVNNNLLVADSSTDHVGVGTSSPKYTLEVIGGIGVTYVDVLGISTVAQEFNVGTGGTVITSLDVGLTGFGTQSPAYIVDIRSPVSTGQTALYVQGDVRVTGDLYADDINLDQATFNNIEVSGVGTIATAPIDLAYVKTGIVTNLSTSGIGSITTAAIRDGYINTGIVTNLVNTGIASISTGIVTSAYINTGIVTTLSGSNVNYSGIGSFGSVNTPTARITTGIVTNLTVSGVSTFQSDVKLADNANLYLGTGNDLQLLHNGSNSFIRDVGTGSLFIDASSTYYRAASHLIQNGSSSETFATFTENGSVDLYYDNSKKFETTGYGATVYGVLQSQGLNVSGLSTVATSKLEIVGAVNLSGTPFYQNANTITSSYTIPVNTNSASYGPIGIDTGVTVGVATGSYWKVL